MNKGLKILSGILFIIIVGLIILTFSSEKQSDNSNIKITTSFYPIFIMTKNITVGVQNVETSNMADQYFGCIHDYALTTEDLKKVENSDVFIQSGNGLEPFSERVVATNKSIKIINCSDDVKNLIENDEGEKNAHTWLSFENYKKEVKAIADKLSKVDENNRTKYEENANNYLKKIDGLEEKYKTLNINNKKAICLDESLEYILRENTIESTLIEIDHDQASLSAEQVTEIIEKMKNEDIKSIFVTTNDNSKTAELLARETGAKIYKLNSAMSGDSDNEAFLRIMKENYFVLKQLGE